MGTDGHIYFMPCIHSGNQAGIYYTRYETGEPHDPRGGSQNQFPLIALMHSTYRSMSVRSALQRDSMAPSFELGTSK